MLIELLKWPTCSELDRERLIERSSEITGEPSGETVGGELEAALWKLIAWAEEKGYDIESPPRASTRAPPSVRDGTISPRSIDVRSDEREGHRALGMVL